LGEWSGYRDILAKSCVGLNESEASLPLSVYPNPVDANLNIVLNSKNADFVSISLINTLGKTVHAEKMNIGGVITKTINTSSLPQGTYLLKVEGNSFNASTKVNIQR
jgi:hypothetical protein